MICPLGGQDCERCPYWPHCRLGVQEEWNSFPERWRDFMDLISGPGHGPAA